MGEVFLAEDAELERRVALKVLPDGFAENDDRVRRFMQEAKAASALNHPNILTIYEVGELDGSRFIATEFIEGETLRERLKIDSLSLRETLDVAIQIASALQAAHSAGIIHRDIKPENIMLREDGLVKILDFGIAKLIEKKPRSVDAEAPTTIEAGTSPGVIIGTANYMSPEQARGLVVDARSDIFSFGIVLYEMITGKKAFDGESAADAFVAILHKEPTPVSTLISDVPSEIERIIDRTLKKDCDERYQTAKNLLTDLKEARQNLEFQNKFGVPLLDGRKPTEAQTEILEVKPTGAEMPPNGGTVNTASSADYVIGEVKKHKRGFAFASVVLLFAAIGFSYWFFSNRASNAKQIESIAVLPFVNESGNADVEYLSDGMTETLISSLSQIPKLNVKARSSVFRYKGKETNAQTIGKELNVQAILNGRVIQRGDELTLYLSLEDAQTGNQIWGDQYNRKTADLVSLQSKIARDVSQKLQAKLSGADEQKLAKNYTENTEAYQLYLRGMFYRNKRTPKDLQKAIEYYQQAVALDSNYALAYAGLSDAYSILSTNVDTPPLDLISKARDAALKALLLDDRLADAHGAQASILRSYDYDFAGAEREYKRAIELNPNYTDAHYRYGVVLTSLGRQEEAFAEYKRALEIEPLSLNINRIYGEGLLFARRYDESIAQLKKTIELDANFSQAHGSLATAYQITGRYAESVEEFAKYQEIIGETKNAVLIRESFAKGGWQGYLRARTGESGISDLGSRAYYTAVFYVELGEKDKAFAELNKAYQNREYRLGFLKVDPRLDPLRDDPRFQELLRKVGFPQ